MKQQKTVTKFVVSVIGLCVVVGAWFLYTGIHTVEAQAGKEFITFEVRKGDTATSLAARLKEDQLIRNEALFKWYVKYKGLDTQIHQGTFSIKPPLTIAKIAQKLQDPTLEEVEITVIPGSNLRTLFADLEEKGIGTLEEMEWLLGRPATDHRLIGFIPNLKTNARIAEERPKHVSFEGYLRPDTYRFFKDATAEEIFQRLIHERDRQLKSNLIELTGPKDRAFNDVLTMASILEREVRSFEDKKKVAGIFWKRHDVGMGLQADSTVHYASGKTGDVFTTNAERNIDNAWNTYKYPGLPPGPISVPSMDSIEAAAFPDDNDYWYFLTDLDEGNVYYATTLAEHNRNVQRYLR